MKKIFLLMVPLLGLGLVGCNNSNVNLDIPMPTYENYENGFNYQSKKKLKLEEVPEESRDFVLENSEDYDVEYEQVKSTASYDDLCTMGVNNDILYPGAIVDIKNGAYSSIYLDRAPLTISMNLETLSGQTSPLSTTIENPNLSSVREGIRTIVSNNVGIKTELPSNISLDIREVTNENEFFLNLGFGLQIKKLNISENFSYSNIRKQTNLAVVLKQVYYTVDVDFNGVKGFFKENITNKDINNAVRGTIPAYVSSVSYGRIAIISIQTNYSKDEITNLLNVSWGKMSDNTGGSYNKKLSVDFDTTLKTISADKDTSISYFVYGGGSDINTALTSITSKSGDSLSSIFKTFDVSSTVGLPISYTMRHLQDNGNVAAKVQSCDEYVVKKVTYNPKKIMDWTFLGKLIEDGTIFEGQELKLDLSAMVDYNNLSQQPTNANRTITIPSNIKDFWLIGPNNATQSIVYNGLSVNVAFRKNDNPLRIHLKDISMIGDTNVNEAKGVAISCESDSNLILDIDGIVSIIGNGNCAIKAQNLSILGEGILSIKGGCNSDALSIAKNLTIDLIGKISCFGGEGSNNGGHGGNAVVAKTASIKFTQDSSFIGGTGGAGTSAYHTDEENQANGINPNGGNGGNAFVCDSLSFYAGNYDIRSGNGGNGSDGISYDRTHNEKGYAADGRHGGKGGNGGCPGTLFECKNISLENDEGFYFNLVEGDAGDGGKGGDGEFAGFDKNPTAYAGNGGNGGYGGSCGGSSLSCISEKQELVCGKLTLGAAGNGGNAGSGGHSDEDWFIGILKRWSKPGYGGIGGNAGGRTGLNYDLFTNLEIIQPTKIIDDGMDGQDGISDYYK